MILGMTRSGGMLSMQRSIMSSRFAIYGVWLPGWCLQVIVESIFPSRFITPRRGKSFASRFNLARLPPFGEIKNNALYSAALKATKASGKQGSSVWVILFPRYQAAAAHH
jgi:hypothetical protein